MFESLYHKVGFLIGDGGHDFILPLHGEPHRNIHSTVLDLCLPLVSMGCYGVLSHIAKVLISFGVVPHGSPSKTLWDDL